MSLRFQFALAATIAVASIGVAAATVSTTTNPVGATKGDRLDWSPVAEQPADAEVITAEPGITVIARQP